MHSLFPQIKLSDPDDTDDALSSSLRTSFIAYKPLSITPCELIQLYIQRFPHLTKGSFSGRLDPMAHGAMKVFFNEDCRNAELAHSSSKKYLFKMILGITTSSCDLLGFPTFHPDVSQSSIIPFHLNKLILSALHIVSNKKEQTLPIYSSHPVANSSGLKKPLWWWAYNNRLNEVQIPTFSRSLLSYQIQKIEYTSIRDICQTAIDRVDRVSRRNKFQQSNIIAMWQNIFHTYSPIIELPIITIEVDVSSGFYIRKLVEDMGKIMEYPTTTFEIERLQYL
jgi:tRNA U55 pseudouridine synthase TruB